jgi:hypothetical protein
MSTDRFGGLPLGTGAIAGGAAYVLGYLFTYLLVGGDVRESALNQVAQAFGGGDLTFQTVGWVFYNAHFVSTIVDVDVPFIGGSSTVNLIADVEAFSAVLYLLPVLLLFGAGLAVGRRHVATSDAAEAAKAGVTVVAGYLPLAAVGAFLFQVQEGSSTAGPDLLLAVLLAGLVYPLVLGALGSVVAGQTN